MHFVAKLLAGHCLFKTINVKCNAVSVNLFALLLGWHHWRSKRFEVRVFGRPSVLNVADWRIVTLLKRGSVEIKQEK